MNSSPLTPPSNLVRRLGLLGLSAVLFALGNLLELSTLRGETASVAVPPAPKVTVAPVEEKLLTEFQELVGRVEAKETVELRPRVSGHVEEVRFEAGQIVHKDDVLFVIDPRWYAAQLAAGEARAAQAKAHADVAEREAKRANELLGAHAISAEEADARRSRFSEAQAAALAAEADLASLKLDVEHTQVRAPITGRISRALVTPGNLVSGAPASATVLATIVSIGDAYVYADVDEATVLKFARLQREGRIATESGRVPVDMQLSDETGYPRHGYIESSDNRLSSSTGSLVLRMVFPDSEGALLPGFFTRVRLPISAPQKTLLISERAIGTDQSQKFVLTVTADKKVAYRTVKLGPIVSGKRIVRDGLQVGDQVVINGLSRIRPGMTVAPEGAIVQTTAPAEKPALASY